MDAVASRSGNQCEYYQLSTIGEQKLKAKEWKDMDCGDPQV
jgi:hypothetical protein